VQRLARQTQAGLDAVTSGVSAVTNGLTAATSTMGKATAAWLSTVASGVGPPGGGSPRHEP